jgi:hypothetical protein
MAKNIFALFFCFIYFYLNPKITRAATTDSPRNAAHLRISLLLSGPGVESWSSFGHICIRVIDSVPTDGTRDVAYNFGMIDDYAESIMHQFLTKRVKASLDTLAFSSMVTEYTETGRQLTEYELVLTDEQKTAIHTHLKKRLAYNQRFYDYDTFFDNCSTEIRDVFEKVFGGRFVAGTVIPANARMTFRNVSFNRYCPLQNKYWFGLGINLIYAGRIDNVMNNREASFVPVYVAESISNGTIDGKRIGGNKARIIDERIVWADNPNSPFLLACSLAILTIGSIMYRKSRVPELVMTTLLLLVSSLLGCFILYTMWLDGDPSWSRNLNLLWALPTNLVMPLLGSKAKKWYALVAMLLIGLTLLVSILHIQFIPLQEIGPLLLALVWVFSFTYRNNSI